MNIRIASFAGVLLTLPLLSTQAHHNSNAHYDSSKTVKITGTVVEFRFISPHIAIILDVPGEDGSVNRWVVDSSASHNVLRRRGWDEGTFKPGDVLTVSGAPHRKDIPQIEARKYTRADGTEPGVPRRSRNMAEVYPPDPSARGIAGVWLPPRTARPAPGTPLGSPLPLTPAGLEAWASYDPLTSPIITCEPMNLPTLYYANYVLDIRFTDENVILHHELYDVTRTVPLNGDPKLQEPSGLFGLAVARMEGDDLVIESSGFPPSRWGLAVQVLKNGNGGDVPSSAEKRLTERYSVIEGGRKLQVEYTLEDPVYMTEPFTDRWEWVRVADDIPAHPFDCDPDSAAQFTGLPLERNPPGQP